MNMLIFLAIYILSGLGFAVSTESCYRRDVFGNVSYITCKDDCCGSLEDKYCCRKTEVGIIAGSVVGVVVFFGIAVTLISCCCCHRIERQGYVKVNEGPQSYESTTRYDIPRTPSLHVSSISEHDPASKAYTDRIGNHEDNAEDVVDVVIEGESKEDQSLTGAHAISNKVDKILTRTDSNDEVTTVTTGKLVEESSQDTLAITLDIKETDNITTAKIDRHTPKIIVTDTDSPTGKHSYVEIINREQTFGGDYDCNSGTNQVIESGYLVDEDKELISDRNQLLQQVHDEYSREADVSDENRKQETILVTDLDTDITQEFRNSDFSRNFGEHDLSDFTDSQGESVLPDLTISYSDSLASDVTVITKEESVLSGNSLLPDLLISEEERLSSKSLQKDGVDIAMGNQNTSVEKVYTFDNPPAGAYVSSGPYPSGSVEVYSDDGSREEIIIDSGTNQPIGGYSDNGRPYNPGSSGAYATPAGGSAYYQPYSEEPMDAYNRPTDAYNRPSDAYNRPSDAYSHTAGAYYQPADAYRDNQPYRDNDPMDAYNDNQPYRDNDPMEAYKDNQPYRDNDNEPYGSDPADAYAVSDDNPADAF